MIPSLENISKVLQDISTQHESRLSTVEQRLDTIEDNTQKTVKDCVSKMKTDIINIIKGDIDKLVDTRNREFQNRRRREIIVTVFNLPDQNKATGSENKREDELDIIGISTMLGWENLNIMTSFRLGKKDSKKTRP